MTDPGRLDAVLRHYGQCPDAWVKSERWAFPGPVLGAYRRARMAARGFAPGAYPQDYVGNEGRPLVWHGHEEGVRAALQVAQKQAATPADAAAFAQLTGGILRPKRAGAGKALCVACGAEFSAPWAARGRPRRYCLTCRPRRASATGRVARHGC
jgi:hypothetical protein